MPGFVRLTLAVTLLIAPCPAQAEEKPPENCAGLPNGGEQKQWAETQYRWAAQALKDAYGRLLERAVKADTEHSPPTGFNQKGSDEKGWAVTIAESQRAWEIYRDAECRGVVGRGGGSGRMVWVWNCLVEKTNERIRELAVPYDQR